MSFSNIVAILSVITVICFAVLIGLQISEINCYNASPSAWSGAGVQYAPASAPAASAPAAAPAT